MITANPSVFDHILDSVVIVNNDMEVVYANTMFANMMDMSIKRLAKYNLKNILHIEEILKKPSVVQEAEIVNDKKNIKVQICAESIQLEKKNAWILFIHDLSVEENLLGKYKKQLKKHESYIRRLDRKLFDMTFLLEISSILNKKNHGTEVFAQALKLISSVFGLDRVAIVRTDSRSEPHIFAAYGLPAEDPFWMKAATESVENVKRVISTTSKNITGNLIYQKEGQLIPDDEQLLHSVAGQFFSRLEQEVLYSSSITDGKTGLFNAQFFQNALKEEIEKAKDRKESVGLIVIDIDFFKKFNDTYGHQTGDLVLVHVAQQIRSATRTSDISARFGGEEFCILTIKANTEGMKKVMERIRTFIEQNPLVTEQYGSLTVTASVGGAIYPEHGENPEELFANADKALYLCKKTGRNKSIIYDKNS